MELMSIKELPFPDPRFANCSTGNPINHFPPTALEYHYGIAAETSAPMRLSISCSLRGRDRSGGP